jgi:hypothetical protein
LQNITNRNKQENTYDPFDQLRASNKKTFNTNDTVLSNGMVFDSNGKGHKNKNSK